MIINKDFKKEDLGADVIAEIDAYIEAVKKEYPDLRAVILHNDTRYHDVGPYLDTRPKYPEQELDICFVFYEFDSKGVERDRLHDISCELEDVGKINLMNMRPNPETVGRYVKGFAAQEVYEGFLYWGEKPSLMKYYKERVSKK